MSRSPTPRPASPLLVLCLLACGGVAGAQTTTTYRWVDAQGVVHYSDMPQPGAEVLHVPAAQTYRATPATPAGVSPTSSDSSGSPYQSCSVVQPAAEASLYAPDSVPVSVSLAPGLRPGDQLTVTLDGTPLGSAVSDSTQFQVQQPDRGAHTVGVMVRDPSGRPVCQSSMTFYVQRPSMLSPASPARGH
jgi:hypothetical protein